MLRTVLSVIVGYAVMVVLVLLGLLAAWSILGAESAFQEGTVVASSAWSLINLVFGLLAAAAGGFAAAAIGKHPSGLPVKALAGVVLALGLLLAVLQLGKEAEPLPAGKAAADLTFREAGDVALSSTWYNFTVLFVGAVGVLIGGRLKSPAEGN